jgi:kinesin family protein 5
VICRFRPINAKEKEEWAGKENKQIIRFSGKDTVEVNLPGQSTQTYTFDFVFPPDSTQEDVYNTAAKLAVQDVLDGFNGTIFAYGQTGSGKSHSMMGPEGSLMQNPGERGIIPRACVHIFDHINNSTDQDTEYTIKCSYLEIYNEMIMDLFNPKDTKQSLKVHESPSTGVWIGDLTEEFVTCEQDVIDLLAIGGANRAISSTNMNKVSSRSHSCFILSVEQKTKDGSTKTGRLNLVDLAGSEKVGKTGATGQTLEEAKKINQSLSALGNCIHSLTDPKKNKHVPYRDSKLTHVLKESLGGNTKTCMLIACSPHEYNVEETISTLKFGQRAKTIKNSVKVNRQLSAAELQARIEALTNQLTALQKYVTSLEQNIAFMKSPDYVPGKPLPNDIAIKPQATAEEVDGATSGANGAGPDSFNTLALAEAQVELQKLKDSTTIKIDDLSQELQFLKEQMDEAQRDQDAKQEEINQLRIQNQSVQLELDTERKQRELENKRFAFQESESEMALEEQQATINELSQAKEELETNLASIENERRQLQQAIDQLERKVRMGNGGSSSEMDKYIAELEDELNKLRKEKTQMEATSGTNQKVEDLEAQLREAATKITLLQGQVDEAEARATVDQETILDELNVAAEKEAELTNKNKLLEEDLRKSKTLVQEQQAQAILAQKQIALLDEAIKGYQANGTLLPEQLDDAVNRVNALLEEMTQEHTAQIKSLEMAHHSSILALQQQVSTLLTEKQMAERKVKEQEAQFNLNQTKTVSENRALKQQLEGTQEENKRLRQKLLLMSSQGGRPASLANLTGDAGEQVRTLESEMQKNQSRLDAATRQLAAEVSKNQIATKRIEQQSQRLHDLEEQATKMVQENAKLAQEATDGKKALTETEELKKLNEQMKLELDQLKLHPRSKIFRPLKSGGSILGAFRERIDFTTIALKSTGSKFLEDARAEAERAELLSKELR